MKHNIKFNHSAKTLTDSINTEESKVQEFLNKVNTRLSTDDNGRNPSRVIEIILEEAESVEDVILPLMNLGEMCKSI